MVNSQYSAGANAGQLPDAAGERAESYIQCRDLFKIFKPADLEVVALRGVDLDIAAGELMAIVGASGSGKTTLLNILAGLESPSAGQVHVGGRDLLDITASDLVRYRRSQVGFVWQATARNLVPYLTVEENLELPQAIAGTPRRERRARSLELLEAMHLADKARRLPDQLSGGEQQRAAIGVGLANRPPLLLADEPTGELDTQMALEVFDMLGQMNRVFGVTVVIVTHYPGVARHVDRVVHIRDGRISSESYLKSTFQRPGSDQTHQYENEYLVVDRAGRLQLPQEYVAELGLSGLAAAEVQEDRVIITRANPEPGRRDPAAAPPVNHPPSNPAPSPFARPS